MTLLEYFKNQEWLKDNQLGLESGVITVLATKNGKNILFKNGDKILLDRDFTFHINESILVTIIENSITPKNSRRTKDVFNKVIEIQKLEYLLGTCSYYRLYLELLLEDRGHNRETRRAIKNDLSLLPNFSNITHLR